MRKVISYENVAIITTITTKWTTFQGMKTKQVIKKCNKYNQFKPGYVSANRNYLSNVDLVLPWSQFKNTLLAYKLRYYSMY